MSLPTTKIFLKTKTKSRDSVVTDIYGKETSKVDSGHTCFVVISLDSALKKNEN